MSQSLATSSWRGLAIICRSAVSERSYALNRTLPRQNIKNNRRKSSAHYTGLQTSIYIYILYRIIYIYTICIVYNFIYIYILYKCKRWFEITECNNSHVAPNIATLSISKYTPIYIHLYIPISSDRKEPATDHCRLLWVVSINL